jgi:hypothetical protein
LIVKETVEDLAVTQQPAGCQVPHVVVAEGLIRVVIGEIDNRSVITSTGLAKFLVVSAPGVVRDPKLIIPAAVERHAQHERPGTEFGQLAQQKLKINPFLVDLECAEKRLLRPDAFLSDQFLAKFAVPLFVIQPELVVVRMSTVKCVSLLVQLQPIQRLTAVRLGRGLYGVFPEIIHGVPVIGVAEDCVLHDSQGEHGFIAGEAQEGAVSHVLQGEPEERSIRQGLWVLEHPARRILPEQ